MAGQTRQPAGAPASTGGQFGHATPNPDAAADTITQRPLLGEAPEFAGGGTKKDVDVVESPVSDRDANYWLNFQKMGSWVEVNPRRFGIQHPDEEPDFSEQATLTIVHQKGNPEQLSVKYVDSEYMDYQEELSRLNLSLEERVGIEETVREAVRAAHGDKVQVQFDEYTGTWDDIRPIYQADVSATPDQSGPARSVYTSNLMAELESDPAYQAIKGGFVEQTIQEALLAEIGE